MASEAFTDKKQKSLWRPIIFIIFLVAAIILLRFWGVGEKLSDLRAWISGLGSWGPLVFVVIYIIAVILALPGSAITIAGAALFGSVWGVVLVSIASTIGASIGFLISRYLARDFIVHKFSQNEKFKKLDQLTKEHGAIIVAITRLVPLFPFNFLNYGFGLTGVRFWTYVFWSWLCMLPGTVLYVVGTDAIVSGLSEGKIPWPLVVVLLIAMIVLTFLVRLARKKLSGREDVASVDHDKSK
ncbi:MAG: hypothetical protein A2031_09585 [Deltaproteobacteria bacterium RBG_19FT_COMBO_43_11]|nr:MAG: hypothetical protein A2W27_10280 [Deltaproteobacteria bacterium RBG_16_44_11]OGP88591.1 MAG: hypothetical protein A2031_09585 [Deltaproteobacteria bacterium RBG_19FT_COMBO_43_11]